MVVAVLQPRFRDIAMTAQRATHGQQPISGAVVSRFAPSPTGHLHLGHAISAIAAHDLAREAQGQFFVRIEDIDGARSRLEFADAILDDLAWLGLDWDPVVLAQSDRGTIYAKARDRLSTLGLAYRCVCTRAEIAASASAPQGDRPPVYPGTCRTMPVTADDPRPACWRLDMEKAVTHAGPLTWTEESKGRVVAHPQIFGDVVIARKDALAAYHLAVVVDDAAQGITDVVRGRDLFEATHIHRLLQALLGLPSPRYHHRGLVRGPDGERLAKRTRGATLAGLRAAGVDGRDLADNLRAGRLPLGFTLDYD
jgi:glutamyl-Q tRNA(Asp) synthetase